jgi:hypothetical protein
MNAFDKQIVNQISELEGSVFIYGAGITAKKLYEYLLGLGLAIDGFIVNQKTVDNLCGKKVLEFSEYFESEINLVLGFCTYFGNG